MTIKINKLKRLRMERGLSQQELSFDARVSPSHICWVEKGHRKPWPSFITKIAKALNVPESEIAGCDKTEELEAN